MRYDFDMFSIIPDEVQQQFQGFINELGMGAAMSEQMALWRDPAVVAALQKADDVVKALFRDAGFGINHYDSGAPAGRFLKQDEPAWNRCAIKFSDLFLERTLDGTLKDADWGGFEMKPFMEVLSSAEPIDEVEVAQIRAVAHQTNKRAKTRKRFATLGLGFGVAALGYAGISSIIS